MAGPHKRGPVRELIMTSEILSQLAALHYAKECLITEDSVVVHINGALHTYTNRADIQALITAQHQLLDRQLQKPELITDGQ